MFSLFRQSLIVLYGEPRYHWEHSILRDDIKLRRVCIAYRELTPPYLPGGHFQDKGVKVLKYSKTYWDHRTRNNNLDNSEQIVNGTLDTL